MVRVPDSKAVASSATSPLAELSLEDIDRLIRQVPFGASVVIGLLMWNLIRYRKDDRNKILGHLKMCCQADQVERRILIGGRLIGPSLVMSKSGAAPLGSRLAAIKKDRSKSNAAVKARSKRLQRRKFGKG